MQTVPSAIRAIERGGPFGFAIEITPRSGDTWPAMRYASKAVAINDNEFQGGYLHKTSRISNSANIREAGAGVTKDSVSFELLDRNDLYKTFITNIVNGRKVTIWIIPLGYNRIKNSSFERWTGTPADFEEWTENTPGADSTIIASSAQKTHGSYSCFMTYAGALPAPKITSNTFKLKRAEYFSLSLDAKGAASGDIFHICIVIDGKYWNFTTRELQAGYDCGIIVTTTAWERYKIESLHWSELGLAAGTEEVDAYIEIEVADSGDSVFFDAVSAEAHMTHRAYIPNELDILSEDILKQYTGEVTDFDWDTEILKVSTNSVLDTYHRDIPIKVLTQEVDSDWIIPADSMGKPFPMTYGYLYGDVNTFVGYVPQTQEFAHGLLVNLAKEGATDPVTVYFDRPGMNLELIGKIYHYGSGAKKYFRELHDDKTTPDYVEWEWVKDKANARAYADSNAGWLPGNKFAVSMYVKGRLTRGSDFTNPANMIDDDDSTYASVTIAPPMKQSKFLLDNNWLDGEAEVLKVYALMYAELTDTSGDCELLLYVIRPSPTISCYALILSSTASFNNIPWSTTPTHKETDRVLSSGTGCSELRRAGIWASSNDTVGEVRCTGANGSAKVYEVAYRVDFTIDLNAANIAGSVQGREYQDAWGGRKTAGAFIRNPVDIVESVLRDELGVPGSEIDTSKFDAASSARSGVNWYAAGQLLEQINSENFLDKYCAEFGLLYYIDLEGKHSIKALDHGDADVVLTENDFIKDTLKPGYTERSMIYNRFILRYDYNPRDDYYAKTIYCNKDDSSFSGADATEYEGKCAASYADLGDVEHELVFEAKWIHGKNTALNTLKWLIDWNYKQRLTLKGSLIMAHAGIEIGDQARVHAPRYIPEEISDVSRFIVEKAELARDRTSINISMFEIKKP